MFGRLFLSLELDVVIQEVFPLLERLVVTLLLERLILLLHHGGLVYLVVALDLWTSLLHHGLLSNRLDHHRFGILVVY